MVNYKNIIIMGNQFVTYEIALKLKELGFDEECFAFYQKEYVEDSPEMVDDDNQYKVTGFRTCKNSEISEQYTCAPLWQEVEQFFRKKYNLNIFYDCNISLSNFEVDWFKYKYKIYIGRNWVNKGYLYRFKTYEEAREQAILKAIHLITENNKNK